MSAATILSAQTDNRDVANVKFVEMPGRYGADGAPVRKQEAGLFHRAIEMQGGNLARHVRLPVTVLTREYTRTEVRDGHIVDVTYRISDEYDAVVFFASRAEFGIDAEFDMGYYLKNLGLAIEAVKSLFPDHRIIATYTTPGTYTAPDRTEARIREDDAEQLFMQNDIVPVMRWAGLDVPFSKQYSAQLENAVPMTENTLVFSGARSLEGGNRRQQALGEVLTKVLTDNKPERLVANFSVGASLRAAEMAVALGIPVTLVHDGSEPSRWKGEKLQERLKALLASDLVTVVGEEAYVPGKRKAVIRELDRLATKANAKKAIIQAEVETEARWLQGAKNLWPQVLAYLKARGDEVTDLIAAEKAAVNAGAQPASAQPVTPVF